MPPYPGAGKGFGGPGIVAPIPPAVPLDPRLKVIGYRDGGYQAQFRNLTFIVTDARHEDGRVWRHASVSRSNRQMPTYWDLLKLKEMTIGPTRTAIQIFPPADRHIDIGTTMDPPVEVLHLWAAPELDEFLPDFGRFGTL